VIGVVLAALAGIAARLLFGPAASWSLRRVFHASLHPSEQLPMPWFLRWSAVSAWLFGAGPQRAMDAGGFAVALPPSDGFIGDATAAVAAAVPVFLLTCAKARRARNSALHARLRRCGLAGTCLRLTRPAKWQLLRIAAACDPDGRLPRVSLWLGRAAAARRGAAATAQRAAGALAQAYGRQEREGDVSVSAVLAARRRWCARGWRAGAVSAVRPWKAA
jgi:hypothetical protein